MASRRQAKKKVKAAKNAEHGNVQASAAASRKKTPQEEIQQADGVQPFLETPEHTEATAKGKSTQVPAPENNALTGETLSMSSGASETESSGDAAQDNAGGAAAPQTKEEAPRKTAAKPNAPEIEEGADVQAGEDSEGKENAAPAEQVPVASEDAEDAGKTDADAGGELELPDEPEGLPELSAAPEAAYHAQPAAEQKAVPHQKARKQKRRHYALFYISLLTLAVVICSAVSIYWMFSTSENGLFDVKEDVELPNLIGTRWTDVKDDAAYSGFVLEKEEVFDDEAPVGEIVDQNPRAPRQVKEGSRIVAKVSKGVEMVTVPELAGWNKDTAREKLRALNLTLLIKPEETTDVPVDCVVRTDPAAGSVVKAGTTVTLYIRRDSTEVSYVTVPACIGSTSEQQASLRLTQRGLAMRVITVEDASPAGTVIAQSPNAGAMVMRGTVVTVTVSSGPPPVVAPPPAPPESESDSEESSSSSSPPPSSGSEAPPSSSTPPSSSSETSASSSTEPPHSGSEQPPVTSGSTAPPVPSDGTLP